LARFHLNHDKLSPAVKRAARDAGLTPECRNPFKSILARSVEVLHACEEALRIMEDYQEPEAPAVNIEAREAIGYGATEAPRGLLYQKYKVAEDGKILEAKIVPPTSQNQKTIENDLYQFIPLYSRLNDEKLRWRCEQAVRNYDPCISCSTHFLQLKVDRE
jgi:coenzyme F420-reducing hydrogenase alpha subunit